MFSTLTRKFKKMSLAGTTGLGLAALWAVFALVKLLVLLQSPVVWVGTVAFTSETMSEGSAYPYQSAVVATDWRTPSAWIPGNSGVTVAIATPQTRLTIERDGKGVRVSTQNAEDGVGALECLKPRALGVAVSGSVPAADTEC